MQALWKQPVKRGQKGQAVIEILASIIIFTIMLALIMTVSAYLYVQHAMISAAREGARMASLNADLGTAAGQGAGEDSIVAYVQDSVQKLTGQNIDAADITVEPPDLAAASGAKQVRVTINYQMNNPIPIAEFLTALGVDDTSGIAQIPVTATAAMRYEE